MNRYNIVTSNDRMCRIEAESIRREGDWLELTKSVPQMETRKVPYPADAANPQGRVEEVLVATGRFIQAPIAIFYKPVSCELLVPESKESVDAGESSQQG